MITKEDLSSVRENPEVLLQVLRCERCLTEYSADSGAYSTRLLDDPFVCCGRSLTLYKKEIVFSAVPIQKRIRVVNGTTYSAHTPFEIVDLLERLRITKKRITVYYGDIATGLAWGDSESGTVSRSTGTSKVPLLINNVRSAGGPALFDDCIVRIVESLGKGMLYQHENFHTRGDF